MALTRLRAFLALLPTLAIARLLGRGLSLIFRPLTLPLTLLFALGRRLLALAFDAFFPWLLALAHLAGLLARCVACPLRIPRLGLPLSLPFFARLLVLAFLVR